MNTEPTSNLFNRHLLRDPIGQESPLNIDVARLIFQNLKNELPNMALVSKKWKALADDETFRDMIRPKETFGRKEWMEYIGVDPGKEPLLPRCIYADLEKEDSRRTFLKEWSGNIFRTEIEPLAWIQYWRAANISLGRNVDQMTNYLNANGELEKGGRLLTFIPEEVLKKNDDGTTERIPLNNLKDIGKLIENPKKGYKTGYHLKCDKKSMKQKFKQETAHWVMLDKDMVGSNQFFKNQRKLAIQSKANVSDILDTTISLFMDYVRSGTPVIMCDCEKYTALAIPDRKMNSFIHVRQNLLLTFVNSLLWIQSLRNKPTKLPNFGILLSHKY